MLRNIIVVRPKKESIVLHGARDMTTLQELEPEPIAKEHGWECVQEVPWKTLDDTIEASKRLNPVESEGYVIRDDSWNRVKVKSPAYVALSHLSVRYEC